LDGEDNNPKDLNALLEILADSRLRMKGLARGREGSEWERSSIMSDLRRELSLAGAKAYSACQGGRGTQASSSE
jgi:hypothetical protein